MYKEHLPDLLPENWVLSDLDEANGYVEFLGFEGEFLISVMYHAEEYPADPYLLNLSQMKGILGRYNFENLDWPEWFGDTNEAIESALKLMDWMNQNYGTFDPVTNYVMVSLGKEERLNSISSHFDGYITVEEFQNRLLVFRQVHLTYGANTHAEAALRAIKLFYEIQGFDTKDLTVGYLTNEKFQLIEDLRPMVLDQIGKRNF